MNEISFFYSTPSAVPCLGLSVHFIYQELSKYFIPMHSRIFHRFNHFWAIAFTFVTFYVLIDYIYRTNTYANQIPFYLILIKDTDETKTTRYNCSCHWHPNDTEVLVLINIVVTMGVCHYKVTFFFLFHDSLFEIQKR